MNLSKLLTARAEANDPIRVGIIGAGKFGTMFLNQARVTRGVHIVGIADLNVERARQRCTITGWPIEQISAANPGEALRTGATCLTDDAEALVSSGALEQRLATEVQKMINAGHLRPGYHGSGLGDIFLAANWSTLFTISTIRPRQSIP